jgi:hypothetical protein
VEVNLNLLLGVVNSNDKNEKNINRKKWHIVKFIEKNIKNYLFEKKKLSTTKIITSTKNNLIIVTGSAKHCGAQMEITLAQTEIVKSYLQSTLYITCYMYFMSCHVWCKCQE